MIKHLIQLRSQLVKATYHLIAKNGTIACNSARWHSQNGTDYANKGRWVDGNLVRFENGFLKPIGGWTKLRNTALTGEPIGMYAYKDNLGESILAVGTRQKVYVLYDNTWTDITPSGFVSDADNDPLGYGAYH